MPAKRHLDIGGVLDQRSAFDRLTNPQEASVPPVSSVAAEGSVAAVGKGKPKREVVKLEARVAQQARNAVVFLRSHGQPHATLASLLDRAVSDYVRQLSEELNAGEEFPDAGALPRGGQLTKGM